MGGELWLVCLVCALNGRPAAGTVVQPRLSVSIQVPSSVCGESPVEILANVTGEAGRDVRYQWAYTSAGGNGTGAGLERLAQAATRSTLRIPGGTMRPGRRHHFRVSATNWVGATASASVDITPRSDCGRDDHDLGNQTTLGDAVHGDSHFRFELNHLEEEALADVRALNPAHNAVVVFLLCLLGVFAVALPMSCAYDSAIARSDAGARQQVAFWREANRVRGSRAVSERSWKRFGEAAKWGLRRRHTWLSACFRPRGDFMTSQKRVLVLLVLLLNSATVCALLVDTDQRLPFLSPGVSAAVVACALAFPVPFLFGYIFDRRTPQSFRVKFESAAAGTWLGACLVLATVCSQGEGFQLELGAEDADDADDQQRARAAAAPVAGLAAGFAGASMSANAAQQKPDAKAGGSRCRLPADIRSGSSSSGGGSGRGAPTHKSSSEVDGSDARTRRVDSSGSVTHKSSSEVVPPLSPVGDFAPHTPRRIVHVDDQRSGSDDNDGVGGSEVGLLLGGGLRGPLPRRPLPRRPLPRSSGGGALLSSMAAWAPVEGGAEGDQDDHGAECCCCAAGRCGSCCARCCCSCCSGSLARVDARAETSVYAWTPYDVIGVTIAAVVIIGECFILAVLSWTYRGKGFGAVLATLGAFSQDMVVRVVVIVSIEAALLAPLCCSRGEARDREGRLYQLQSDTPAFTFDADGVVVALHDAGEVLGIRVGWRIKEIDGQSMASGRECREAIRRAHCMHDSFGVRFDQSGKESKRSSEDDGVAPLLGRPPERKATVAARRLGERKGTWLDLHGHA